MKIIRKLILKNFKRFRSLELDFKEDLNILIGGNEAGKSSVLQALDIAMSISRNKVETLGLETLFNKDCITEFLESDRLSSELPEMSIELHMDGIEKTSAIEFDGRNNSKGRDAVGIRLICQPADEYLSEIKEILKAGHDSFPFECYTIKFFGFSGEAMLPYNKPLKYVLIDSAQIGNEYAMNVYTKSIYHAQTSVAQRNRHGIEYRRAKSDFRNEAFKSLNEALRAYKFDVRTNSKSNVETDIIITEDGIPIDNKGKGRQCFVKTEFALQRKGNALDIVLLEEPENHLSHINMKKLIESIRSSENRQIFIATHSSFAATRLNLKNVIMMGDENPTKPASLSDLNQETADFFMKAPDNNILEFALCKKVLLVEGDAEFILMDMFYRKSIKNGSADADGIHIISIGGTSFKRYMELARILGIRVAVIRDNDHNYQQNCVDNYEDYVSEAIKVFADKCADRHTFEICLYQDNKDICEAEFSPGRKTLNIQQFMLNNKADVALVLLKKHTDAIVPPAYIKEAIEWIRE